MLLMRSVFLAFFGLLLALSAPLPAQSADMAQAAVHQAQQPGTNAEIRQWYNDQVAVIPAMDEKWQAEVADLQARDQEKYGNPDGPSFAYLVQKNREKGLAGDAVYEDIIGSANRTNKAYNEKFGVSTPSKVP